MEDNKQSKNVTKVVVVGSAVAVTVAMGAIKIIGRISLKVVEAWLGF